MRVLDILIDAIIMDIYYEPNIVVKTGEILVQIDSNFVVTYRFDS